MNKEVEESELIQYLKEYRLTTNDLINKYISGYALEQFRNECNIKFGYQYEYDLFSNYGVLEEVSKREITIEHLKQALIDIKEKSKGCITSNYGVSQVLEDILKIIDKVLGDEK